MNMEEAVDSAAQAIRWGVAGGVGGVVTQVEFPPFNAYMDAPVMGAVFVGTVVSLFLIVLGLGTVIDLALKWMVGSFKDGAK